MFLLAVLGVVPLAGCATKRDLRELRDEIRWLRERQDSANRELGRLAGAGLDSLARVREELVRTRGDLARQLVAIEEQLLQVQELAGQNQRRLAELRDRLEQRARTIPLVPVEGADTGAAAVVPGPVVPVATDAEAAYNAAVTQFQRGSLVTARRGFEDFLKLFPRHNLAPHAQLMLAETYERENRVEEAIREFQRIPEVYPTSDRVPVALYRVGLLEEKRNDRAAARRYFERVVNNYPNSDAAALAREALARLRR